MNPQETFHEDITELNEKYIVLKREDVKKFLNLQNQASLNDLLGLIHLGRGLQGKPKNEYLVLNLDDDIDLYVLFTRLQYLWKLDGVEARFYNRKKKTFKVKEIAVEIVNAILRLKKNGRK